MADWGNIYAFNSDDDLSSRVRRLERGRQYLRAGNLVSPSGDFQSMPVGLIDPNLKIDIVTGINPKGSIPPAGIVGNFGFTATTSSITIYWDGTNGSTKLKIIRTDQTAVQIPTNNMTISGLSANTTYSFLPFWSVFNNCGIGFVKGDSGTPQFAFSAAAKNVQSSVQQSLQGREALTAGFVSYATTASGTSGGSGTGGGYGGAGDGMCVMVNTHIKPMGENQTYITRHAQQTDWVNLAIDGFGNLSCTPNHPLYTPEKQQRADQFKAGDWILTACGEMKLDEVRTFYRDCTKMQVEMPVGHLFYANGFLSHNAKLNIE
jgi:hypothetical protein